MCVFKAQKKTKDLVKMLKTMMHKTVSLFTVKKILQPTLKDHSTRWKLSLKKQIIVVKALQDEEPSFLGAHPVV